MNMVMNFMNSLHSVRRAKERLFGSWWNNRPNHDGILAHDPLTIDKLAKGIGSRGFLAQHCGNPTMQGARGRSLRYGGQVFTVSISGVMISWSANLAWALRTRLISCTGVWGRDYNENIITGIPQTRCGTPPTKRDSSRPQTPLSKGGYLVSIERLFLSIDTPIRFTPKSARCVPDLSRSIWTPCLPYRPWKPTPLTIYTPRPSPLCYTCMGIHIIISEV